MNPTRRRLTVRLSKARLAFWAVCLVVIGFLTYQTLQAPVATTGRLQSRQDADTAEQDGVRIAPEEGRPAEKPAVRFGVLTRAAHLVALSGLQMNLYGLATQGESWLEPRLFVRPEALSAAIENGEIDLALLPLREVVRLFLKLGERAPRVLAGAAEGDEMYVLRKEVPELDFTNLRPVRVALLEPPSLDIRKALRLDSAAPPLVSLEKPDTLGQALASREVDFALAPEPLASLVAAVSGSRVARPSEATGGDIQGGAALVASVEFVRTRADLLDRLVQMHVVSALTVQNGLDMAARRAIAIIERAGLETPAFIFWQQAIQHIRYQSKLPNQELQALLETAKTQAKAGADRILDGLMLPALLENALRELEEGAAEK